jgi:cytochrome c-type biogenesis protein
MTFPAELGLTAFLVALAAGAASFLSPCVLPLLPAYLSFVSGLSVEEVEKGDRRVLFSTLGFVLGFSIVFTLLGAGFSFVGGLIANQRILEIVAGVILVILGAIIAGATAPSFMQRDMRPLLGKAPRGPAGRVVEGIAYSLGCTP